MRTIPLLLTSALLCGAVLGGGSAQAGVEPCAGIVASEQLPARLSFVAREHGRRVVLDLSDELQALSESAERSSVEAGGTFRVDARIRSSRTVRARLTLAQRGSAAHRAVLVKRTPRTWVRARLASTLHTDDPTVVLRLRAAHPTERRNRFSVGRVRITYTPPPRLAGQLPEPGLGVYNGAPNDDPDQSTLGSFGAYPDAASTYYQVDQRINQAYEQARMARGTSPNITITTQGTQHISGIVTGNAASLAWLDRYVEDLRVLAQSHPDVNVYVTLDHEFRVKVNRGMVTGESASPSVYGQALSIFYDRVHAAAPNLKATYWFVGYDRGFEGTVGDVFAQPGNADPDYILFDPYANHATDTIASITASDISWIKAEPWYLGQPIALGEFGMPVALGDEAMSGFYADLRSQFDASGLAWGVFFNRERDNNHKITVGGYPKAVSSFATSIQG
ncbi:exported hypothetical protein [metagenome]|uniref:GH26 domain-containing protein n=1 Tax=metagenome TaxID=256318 RepID=A0A2P2C8D2_9ZZZZ